MAIFLACSLLVVVADAGAGQRAGGGGTGGGTGRGRMGQPAQPAETSQEDALLSSAKERVKQLNKAVANLEKVTARAMPKDLSTADQQQWSEQSTWIGSLKARYAAHSQALDTATQAKGDPTEVAVAISRLYDEFDALQAAAQEEGRKFTTLSKAAKSRQDAAMNAIRSIK